MKQQQMSWDKTLQRVQLHEHGTLEEMEHHTRKRKQNDTHKELSLAR